jgi:hypothetical protein
MITCPGPASNPALLEEEEENKVGDIDAKPCCWE